MNKTAKEHWEVVAQEMFAQDEEGALELSKRLKQKYNAAIRELEKQINAFYGEYADSAGLDISKIQKQLSRDKLKSFQAQIDEYIKWAKDGIPDNTSKQAYIRKLQLLKAKVKVSRLEELKANLEYEIAKLVSDNYQEISEYMQEIYEDNYLKAIYEFNKDIGFSTSFVRPNTKAVENYLGRNINIANYSIGENGIWQKINQLTNLLNTRIPQGLILGQNPKKVAEIANKTMGTDYNNAVRLVRTEYNYTFNQATKDGYEECGVEQYQVVVALDERTCQTCGDWDLIVQEYDDIIVGTNYPPFHPNCRCTTIPYFDPEEYGKRKNRIARDENGKNYMVPADLTFNEWKAGLTEHKGGVQYYKPKGR